MLAAGACSAGAIVLLRELPRFAPGMPALLIVGVYMLLGGIGLLAGAAVLERASEGVIPWPKADGLIRIAAIGVLLAALEVFFVIGSRNLMPLPDGMIVYNVTGLALVSVASVIMFAEPVTVQRGLGLGLGVASMLLLLQPVRMS